ncbi:MAG: hypothetical protein K0R92_2673 [Lachnospiraceae bacterium]|jgi:hypothetical protein|nr:hypothetical protein [Lachnospiraceae bacterium]MDF2845122.1 hypothetical protein [Herbinix sp.]
MAVYPNGVIKCFDIFKNKLTGMIVVTNSKPIQPFSLNERMEDSLQALS